MTLSASFGRNLSLIVALAFVLRIVGINFGLPYIYHQDEPILVNHAVALGEQGWNPHFFVLPSFTIYFLFILYGIAFVVGHLLGMIGSQADFAISFLKDPTLFYLLGRLTLGAIFGSATVWVLGRLGRDFFSARTGLLAALFLSVSFLHATHSHYIYADIPLAFMVTVMSYFIVRAFKMPAMKNYIISGIFLGLAVSVKYTAVYFVPAILAGYFFVNKKESFDPKKITLVAMAVLSAVAVYCVVVPYTILDWGHFSGQVLAQSGAENPVGFLHHFFYSILNGTSLPFLAAALFGIKPFFRQHPQEAFFFSAMVVVYYAVNAVFSQPFARYMMPILPILCLCAAFGCEWISDRFKHRPGSGAVVQTAVVLSLILPTIYADYLFLKKDTRDQCFQWIEKNATQNETIVVDSRYYAPHLRQTEDQIKEKYALLKEADPAGQKRLDLLQTAQEGMKSYRIFTLSQGKAQEDHAFLFQKPFVEMDLEALQKIGAKYLILNYSDHQSRIQTFKRSILSHLELKAEFSPYRDPRQKLMADVYSTTSAPDSQAELFGRRRLGPYLEVYSIRS